MFTMRNYPQIKWLQRVVKQYSHSNFVLLIDTMDNPGWSFKANIPIEVVNENINISEKDEQNWINAYTENNYFICYCGPLNLGEAISILKNFLESKGIIQKDNKDIKKDKYIDWLQNWYLFNCDGDWEHSDGIHIDITGNESCKISINLENIAYIESEAFELNKNHFNSKLDNYELSVSAENRKLTEALIYAKRKILVLEKKYGYYPEHAKMKEFTGIQREFAEKQNHKEQ